MANKEGDLARVDTTGEPIDSRTASADIAYSSASAKALIDAAEWLMSHGWIQGRMTRTDVRNHLSCCAFGALDMVASGLVTDVARGEFYRVTGRDLVAFNDTPGQRRKDIVAKMREAAALIEGR